MFAATSPPQRVQERRALGIPVPLTMTPDRALRDFLGAKKPDVGVKRGATKEAKSLRSPDTNRRDGLSYKNPSFAQNAKGGAPEKSKARMPR